MIISDTEQFAFVHNPKCGGMSCRNQLARYDTRDNFFFEWKPVNAEGKVLDMAHITPFQLRRFYPKAFQEVQGYLKFGFVRDPYERFLSAVSQHLKLSTPYLRTAILADPDIFYLVAASFAQTALQKHPVENDHKLVHFRPQSHFHNIDGKRWTDHVFRLEAPEALQGTPLAGWLPSMTVVANKTEGYADKGYEVDRLGRPAIDAISDFYEVDFRNFDFVKR